WYPPAFQTQCQRLLRVKRNTACGSKVIRGTSWDYAQCRPRRLREIHETVNHLIQCTVATGGNQQIRVACFRRKPPGVPCFPGYSYLDPISDCSLLHNCGTERVTACCFAIENQLNCFSDRPRSHFRSPNC